MNATIVSDSNGRIVKVETVTPWWSSSDTEIADANAESFTKVTKVLAYTGNILITACGRTTRRMTTAGDIPKANAAWRCPREIERIPALNVSA